MNKTPQRILFICLGNICRSPAAQGIFQSLDTHKHFHVESRATSSYHQGAKPSKEMQLLAEQQGFQLNSLSAPITQKDFETFDILFVADESVKKNLEKRGAPIEKLKFYTHYSPQIPSSDIPDPYSKGIEAYKQVFTLLQEVIQDLYQALNSTSRS